MPHNPFTAYQVTDNWEAHLARGSKGGTDYAMPVGTALPAVADGVLSNLPDNGSGGNTAVITHADGSKTVYMHLSKFTDPRTVKEGEIIGYSGGEKGAPGAGNSTGPHLHIHGVKPDGTRVPMESINPNAGGSFNPLDPFGTLGNALGPFNAATKWLTTPENWIRIAWFVLGTTLLLFVIIRLFAKSEAGQAIGKAAGGVVDTAAILPTPVGAVAKGASVAKGAASATKTAAKSAAETVKP